MKKKSRFLWIVFFVFSVINIYNPTVLAADDLGIGFEVQPIFSSTQIDVDRGYYYVKTTPGVKQKIEMSVYNTGDKDITVKPKIENAIASTAGTIAYNADLNLTDKTLKQPLTEILIPDQETLTIAPGKKGILTFTLNTPSNSYDGIKMGRITVIEENKEEKKKSGVSTEYQYALGVILSESGDAFNDGQILNLNDVKATIDLGRRSVVAEIVNPEPKTIENLKVRSYVTKKGSSTKIKQNNIDNFVFPPNSKLNFLIPWGLTNFEPGEYIFYFNADNGYENFPLKKEFTIRGNEANKLNKETAFKVNTPTYIKVIIVVMNAALILVAIFIIIRNKKWMEILKNKHRGKGKKKVKNTKRSR